MSGRCDCGTQMRSDGRRGRRAPRDHWARMLRSAQWRPLRSAQVGVFNLGCRRCADCSGADAALAARGSPAGRRLPPGSLGFRRATAYRTRRQFYRENRRTLGVFSVAALLKPLARGMTGDATRSWQIVESRAEPPTRFRGGRFLGAQARQIAADALWKTSAATAPRRPLPMEGYLRQGASIAHRDRTTGEKSDASSRRPVVDQFRLGMARRHQCDT